MKSLTLKVLSLVLALSLLLAACAPAATPEPTQPAQAEQPTQAAEATAALEATQPPADNSPVKIGGLVWGEVPPLDTDFEKCLEEQTGVQLEMAWVPFSDLTNRNYLAIASGDMSDTIEVLPGDNQMYTGQIAEGIADGVFLDQTPYVKAADFAEKYPNLGKIPPQIWDNISYDGKIYGIPYYLEPFSFGGIWLRVDLFEKAGYKYPDDLPTTVEQLAEVAKKISVPGAVYGFHMEKASLDAAYTKSIANSFTGASDWSVGADGNWTYQAFMPEYKDFLNWLKDLYAAGAINPEFMLEQNGPDILNGKAGVVSFRWHALIKDKTGNMIVGGTFAPDVPADAKYVLLPPLQGPKGPTVEANTGFWTQAMVNAKAEGRIENILKFLDFVADQQGYHTGRPNSPWFPSKLEEACNKDYFTVNSDGTATMTDKFSADGVGTWGDIGLRDAGTDPAWWVEQARINGGTEEDLKNMQDGADAYIQAFLGATSIRNVAFNLYSPTMAEKWPEIAQKINENRIKYVTGQMSEADWDAFVKGIVESADYQKIVAERKAAAGK